MWLLTIIVFSHSCSQLSGDAIFNAVCGERQGEITFTSEKACFNALDGIDLQGKPRFREGDVRLTDAAIAFCDKRKY